MSNPHTRTMICLLSAASLLALSACEEGGEFNLGDRLGLGGNNAPAAAAAPASGRTVEQDVEAPEVFSATEAGLWDGRPSLGGVWVAHPDVKDPERVIIRNTENGKFVVGALFRRERDIPGPRLQISSDAAAALGVLAGTPVELNVTALRREEVPVDPPAEDIAAVDALEDAPSVTEEALDPIAAASAAIDAAPETNAERIATDATAAAPAPAPAPQPAPSAPASRLSKPYLQVGIFSVEANANRTASQMRAEGMIPAIRKGETAGKPFWRVIVGPAQTSAQRRGLLDKIRGAGFTDAYPVSN